MAARRRATPPSSAPPRMAEQQRLDEDARRKNIGNAGGPISANAHGAPSAKITARTVPPGNDFPTTMPAHVPIAGMKTALPASAIATRYICFALALWNGRDPILKERLFGLTGNEGNHGEDVKEYYFYLDSTPTHSYMKYLYKYPQAEFPYASLVEENRRRGRQRSWSSN